MRVTRDMTLAAEVGTGPQAAIGSGTQPRAMATWLHWLLRIGVLWEFVGHGAFGIIGKEGWLPYYGVFGISDSWAWRTMPLVGAVDIAVGTVTLVRPMRAVLVYATFWASLTAVLRPLAGQGTWEEVFERGGNIGLPLALLILVGWGRRGWRRWFEHARARPLDADLAQRLGWVLRLMVALLLVGHGAFGLSHLHDQEWTAYFSVLGIGPDTILALHLIAAVGWFEVALGAAVLVWPARGLIGFVAVWKVATELLRPLAGEPIFEFVERAGDWFLPAALLGVQSWQLASKGRRPVRWGPRRWIEGGAAAPMRVAAGAAACVVLVPALVVFRGRPAVIEARDVALRAEPTAGAWRTWVLPSPADLRVPPPPAPRSERARLDAGEVARRSLARTAEVRRTVAKWNGPLPTEPWAQVAFDIVSRRAKDPPLSSRNYALVSAAAYDAVVAAWHWKYQYNVEPPAGVPTLVRPGPDPSYPSEHAAIAGAASRVLAGLYPDQSALRLDEMAEEAAWSRVAAGVNTPSDVEAGLDLGRRAGDAVLAYARGDGADRPWDGRRPAGIGRGPAFWEPPPGSPSPPTAPLAGTWRPWVLRSGDQFRPPPPPAYGSPTFVAAAEEMVEIARNLTPGEKGAARFYEGAEGTVLPAGIIVNVAAEDVRAAATGDIAARQLTVPRIARAFALLNVALADAGIATWDAKFAYWNPRPENAIRDLGLDPDWKPLLSTPRFPAYPSGSAGYAGASQVVLSYLFPDQAEEFRRRAEGQAESRLFAGVHWRYDSAGLAMGRAIGALVVQRAQQDGAGRG